MTDRRATQVLTEADYSEDGNRRATQVIVEADYLEDGNRRTTQVLTEADYSEVPYRNVTQVVVEVDYVTETPTGGEPTPFDDLFCFGPAFVCFPCIPYTSS